MLIVLWSILGGILAYNLIMLILGAKGRRSSVLSSRLNKISSIDNQDISSADNMNVPFSKRVIEPIIQKVTNTIGNIMPSAKKDNNRILMDLRRAGIWLSPKEYTSRTVIIMIIAGIIGALLGLMLNISVIKIFLLILLSSMIGYSLRRFSLKSKITKRKEEIQRQLPSVLDLLCISVTAGLGFDQALGYLTSKDKGALIEELEIARRETTLGKTRKDALLSLSERCDVEELKTFISAVNQSEELGISLKNVLLTQSSSIRIAHKQKIEEKAMKIPVKIIFPIVVFIFPVIFIVILGPAIPEILKGLRGY